MSPIPPNCTDCACSGGGSDAPDGRGIYSNYLFDSSVPDAALAGNVYNDWNLLMTHISTQLGPKSITFIQDETLPPGAYNLRDVTLRGDFTQFSINVELPAGFTVTDWTNGVLDAGIHLWSSSPAPIYTAGSPGTGIVLIVTAASAISSTVSPMLYVPAGATYVIGLSNGGVMINGSAGPYGGSPVLDRDAAAVFVAIALVAGYFEDDTLSGTGMVLRMIQDVNGQYNAGLVQPNLVGPLVDQYFTSAKLLGYDNSVFSLLQASDAQDAIDELAELDLKVVAGPVSDLDFTNTPPDGARGVDTVNERLYVRVNGTWKYTALI